MTHFSFHKGDLLEADEKVIAHGCNTYGVMGAGIAGQISKKYPGVFREYKAACDTGEFVLGSAQLLMRTKYPNPTAIFNLGTQWAPGPNAEVFGIYLAFANMIQRARTAYGLSIGRVAIPRIGCGIGGLTWDLVEPTIENAIEATGFKGFEIAVYDL